MVLNFLGLTQTLIRHRYQAVKHQFFAALDAQGVGIFQAIVYVHIGLFAGLYGLLVAGGTPQTVEDVMGPVFNGIWLWLCLAIMTCLAGKCIKHDAGMWMQLSGDLAANIVLLVYILAIFNSSWWGKALFGVFLALAIWECTLLLIIRDIRRIGIDLGWIQPAVPPMPPNSFEARL